MTRKCAKNGREGRLLRLTKITPDSGKSWLARLPSEIPRGDHISSPQRSIISLFEGDREIGPAHASHQEIRAEGLGRFSHWDDVVYFSTSDNTDPRKNGRAYRVMIPAFLGDSDQLEPAYALVKSAKDVGTEESRYELLEKLGEMLCPKYPLAEYGRSMFEDEWFLEVYRRFDDNLRSLDRKFAVYQFAKLIAPLDGDTAECGVWRGAASYFIAQRIAELELKKTHHLFDSFEGLSKPDICDGPFWATGEMRFEEDKVRENLREFSFLRFYKGWIPERFCEVSEKSFCFVHIDVDLYEPTRASLEFFYPRMVSGGIIICDDYGFSKCPGARRAIDEFFKAKAERIIELPTGQGIIFRSPPGD